jgi:Zinc ribbon domain.
MRLKEYSYNCNGCGNSYTIITDSEEAPEVCPFCGEDLDNERDEDESEEE